MSDSDQELQQVYLQPGEVHLARCPSLLKTILGSCVGVTFWSPRHRIGALCHGILPRSPGGLTGDEGDRYVDFAIRDLLTQFDHCGVYRGELQIKVFGGADVLPVHEIPSRRATVGCQNREAALEVIRDEGLTVMASDLGGLVGRTVQFNTLTGEVLVRRLAHLVVSLPRERTRRKIGS